MAPAALVLAVALATAAVVRVGAAWNSDAVVVDGQAVTCPCTTVCRLWEPEFLEGGGAGVARSQPLCGVDPFTCTAAAAPGTSMVVAVAAAESRWYGLLRVPLAKCSAPITWTSAWVDAYNMSTAARPVQYDVAWQPTAASPNATRGFTLRLHCMPTTGDYFSTFLSSPYSAYQVTDFGVFNTSSARLAFEPLRIMESGYDAYDSIYTYYDFFEIENKEETRAAAWYVLRACFVDDQTACWDSPRFHVMRSLGVKTFLYGDFDYLATHAMRQPVEGSSNGAVIRLGGSVAMQWAAGVGISDGVTAAALACPVVNCRVPFGGLTVQNTLAAGLWSGGQKCATLDVTSALANPTRMVSGWSGWGNNTVGAFVAVSLPSSTACSLPATVGLVLEADTTVRDANGVVQYSSRRSFSTLNTGMAMGNLPLRYYPP